VDRFPGGGFDRDGGVRIELPLALAAHHQIPIPCRPQPGEILFRGQPAVHDDQGTRRRTQTLEHPG
jgi:hypothetical protein